MRSRIANCAAGALLMPTAAACTCWPGQRASAGARSSRARTAPPPLLLQQQQRQRRACCCASSAYDHPALYSSEDTFAERSYWDQRYESEALGYEWYRDYSSLRPVLTRHLPRAARLLQLGVGTSGLQVDMALRDGYSCIHSIDYSPVAVERLEEAAAKLPEQLRRALSYEVADMRRLAKHGDASFGGALDKGGLDALLCGDDGEADAAAALAEVWRVLEPGAAYVMVTSAAPRARLPVLASAPGAAWASMAVYEVGQQGALAGPFDAAADAEAVAQLPRMAYSHFAYVAVKAG